MSKHAIVRDGVVENIIDWDGDTEKWSPPEGATAHPFDGFVSIGWLWNGGSPVDPDPAPEPAPVVPTEVYALQFRRALRFFGKIDAANAWVAQQPAEVQEAWEYATKIYYADPLVTEAAALLDIDKGALFLKAATY